MAESKIAANKGDVVFQLTKTMYLDNQQYATVLTREEIEELVGHTITGGLNAVSVYAYNGDWDAVNFHVTSIIRQKNLIIAFFSQAITHDVRLNFIIAVKRNQLD